MYPALLATLLACGPGVDPSSGTAEDVPGWQHPGANGIVDPSAGEGLPTECGVSGLLVGPDGEPLPDFEIVSSSGSSGCYVVATGPDGWFDLPTTCGDSAIHTQEDPGLLAALVPAHTDDAWIDLSPVYVPERPLGAMPGPDAQEPQAIDVGDGLTLVLVADDVSGSFGQPLTQLGARKIPSEYLPDYPALDGDGIAAVYALHPFGGSSSSPVGLSLLTDLPAGTPVEFRTIDVADGTFSEPVPGSSDGTVVATAEGEGIRQLTYVVISVP